MERRPARTGPLRPRLRVEDRGGRARRDEGDELLRVAARPRIRPPAFPDRPPVHAREVRRESRRTGVPPDADAGLKAQPWSVTRRALRHTSDAMKETFVACDILTLDAWRRGRD